MSADVDLFTGHLALCRCVTVDVGICPDRIHLYVGGDLDKASYRRRADELDAELHGAELAFADRLTHKTLVGIPTTYEALAELWDQKGIELQRLLIEAVRGPGRHRSPPFERR